MILRDEEKGSENVVSVFELMKVEITENNTEQGVNAFFVRAEVLHLRTENKISKLFKIKNKRRWYLTPTLSGKAIV